MDFEGSRDELACSYAAMILADEGLDIAVCLIFFNIG